MGAEERSGGEGVGIGAGVRERLRAYILPRRPETDAQQAAFELAVAAQAEYDARTGMGDAPAGVTGFSIGDYSVTLAQGADNSPGYTGRTISPDAWAILRNAGLVAYALPTAKKL